MAEITSSSLISSLAPMKDVSRRSIKIARLSSALPRKASISFCRSCVDTGRKSILHSPLRFSCRGEGFLDGGGRSACQFRKNREDCGLQFGYARIDLDNLASLIPIIPRLAFVQQE